MISDSSIVVMSDSLRDIRVFQYSEPRICTSYVSADGKSTESSDIHPF